MLYTNCSYLPLEMLPAAAEFKGKGLCTVYEAIQVRHENVILYLNIKSREVLSLLKRVNNAPRNTQAAISYAIRSFDR